MRIGPRFVASVLVLSMILTAIIPGSTLAFTAPTVTVVWPKADQVLAGNISVEGQASGASSVEVNIDSNASWRPATGTSAWNYTWASKGYANGYHNISARAKNGTAVSSIVSVRIFINNTQPKDIVVDLSATPLQIAAGGNVTVSGFIEYDTGVTLASVPVKIEVLTTNISLTVDTDRRGYLIRTFHGPLDANKYTLRASVTDGKLSANKDFQLSVTTPTQPDLVLKSIYLDPVQPAVGVTVSICATIENLGPQSATAIIKFYIDGNYLDSQAVQIDRSTVVRKDWLAAYGAHMIKVVADNVNPMDKDMSNNQRSMVVTPTAEPDVSITGLVVSNQGPHKDDIVSILVKLENTGYAGTTGTLKLWDGDPGTGKLIGSIDFSLRSNETTDIYITWKAVQGQHTLTAQASVVGQAEKPQRAVTITVLPPVQVKKPFIPFPGAIELLSILAMTAMSITLKRRSKTTR
jgi:hypothetical protein